MWGFSRVGAIAAVSTGFVLVSSAAYFVSHPGGDSLSASTPAGADASSSGEGRQATSNNTPIVRIGMSAAFVSEHGVGVYREIADYLSKHAATRCEFVAGLSYATINEMLEDGVLQVAFVCGLPYVLQQEMENPPTRLLAAPVMKAPHYDDQPKYYSYTIVHKDSGFHSFKDLRGCVYVYNDELSNSGYNLPRSRLIELGATNGFFSKVLRSGSHEESIRMVAEGKADASSVDSLVFDYDLAQHPQFASQVRIIERLGPAGICPVVASTKMADSQFQRIQAALLGMSSNDEGIAILDRALVDRFVVVTEENYDDIRMHLGKARNADYMEIK